MLFWVMMKKSDKNLTQCIDIGRKYKIRHFSMLDRMFQMAIQIIIILTDISRTRGWRWRGRIAPLCSTLLRVLLNTASSFKPPTPHLHPLPRGKTLINWNKLSRRPSSWLGLEHLLYEEVLRDWALLSLEITWVLGNLTAAYPCPRRGQQEHRAWSPPLCMVRV